MSRSDQPAGDEGEAGGPPVDQDSTAGPAEARSERDDRDADTETDSEPEPYAERLLGIETDGASSVRPALLD